MKNIPKTIATFILLFSVCQTVCAREYYVSTGGKDTNSGEKDKPFRTISKAATSMQAGDICIVRAGTYRETVHFSKSGTKDSPIKFIAAPGEEVILDGTEPVIGDWSIFKDNIYKVAFNGEPFEQLFVEDKMMVEARWPNMTFEQRFDRSSWAQSGSGSKQDLMICDALVDTDIDWTGALATLNVGQQFKTWTRTVKKHDKNSNRFTYFLDERVGNDKSTGKIWEDDYFFLTGKLEALDSPTEWFFDKEKQLLYLWTTDGGDPQRQKVMVKKRSYAFDFKNCEYVQIKGFKFFATTFQLVNSDHCVIEDCQMEFPTYTRRLKEMDPQGMPRESPATLVDGNHNIVRKVGLAYSNNHGLSVNGQGNLVDNCIVHDVNWSGAFAYPGISLKSSKGGDLGNKIIHSTVSSVGNMGIWFAGFNNEVGYNHVFKTGLVCKDIAAVHTGSPATAGSVAHHNWIHGAAGKGLRGDDQTRNLTFHNNVVWDCRDVGIIMKGDNNYVYNNTLIGPTESGILLIPTRTEPKKWWTIVETLEIQNENSFFFNNLVVGIEYRDQPLTKSDNIFNNIVMKQENLDDILENIEKQDFRPKEGSGAVGTGRIMKNKPTNYKGKAPDIGAYDYGGENWKAGADWKF